MEQFRLDLDGINRTIKARAMTMAPVMFISMLFGLYIATARSGQAIEAIPAIVVIVVVTIFMIIVVYFGSQGFRRSLESYTLTFDDNLIIREQHNTPNITFTKADITEIARDKKGSYRIKAESWTSPMKIPSELENADRLYQLLSNIVPVTEKVSHDSMLKKIGIALAIVAVILTFVLFELSKDKAVKVTSGVILMGVIIYSILKNRQDKNVDYSTKGSLWLKAVFLMSIIISIYNNLKS